MQNPEQNLLSKSLILRYNAIIIIPGDIICSVEKDYTNAIQKKNNKRKVQWNASKRIIKMHLHIFDMKLCILALWNYKKKLLQRFH